MVCVCSHMCTQNKQYFWMVHLRIREKQKMKSWWKKNNSLFFLSHFFFWKKTTPDAEYMKERCHIQSKIKQYYSKQNFQNIQNLQNLHCNFKYDIKCEKRLAFRFKVEKSYGINLCYWKSHETRWMNVCVLSAHWRPKVC